MAYMENRVNFIHRKILFHLYDEEVDHLFVRLKQVNGIVAFTDEDLAVFAGQEFHEFFVNDGRMSKFERTIDQRYVVRIVLR